MLEFIRDWEVLEYQEFVDINYNELDRLFYMLCDFDPVDIENEALYNRKLDEWIWEVYQNPDIWIEHIQDRRDVLELYNKNWDDVQQSIVDLWRFTWSSRTKWYKIAAMKDDILWDIFSWNLFIEKLRLWKFV